MNQVNAEDTDNGTVNSETSGLTNDDSSGSASSEMVSINYAPPDSLAAALEIIERLEACNAKLRRDRDKLEQKAELLKDSILEKNGRGKNKFKVRDLEVKDRNTINISRVLEEMVYVQGWLLKEGWHVYSEDNKNSFCQLIIRWAKIELDETRYRSMALYWNDFMASYINYKITTRRDNARSRIYNAWKGER